MGKANDSLKSHKQCLHGRDLKKKINEHFRLGTAGKLLRLKKSERAVELKNRECLSKTRHNYALELILRLLKIFYTLPVLTDLVLLKLIRELFTHMFKEKIL